MNIRKQKGIAGGARVLPPPREVIEQDNKAAMAYPPATSSEPAGYSIPTEQV